MNHETVYHSPLHDKDANIYLVIEHSIQAPLPQVPPLVVISIHAPRRSHTPSSFTHASPIHPHSWDRAISVVAQGEEVSITK